MAIYYCDFTNGNDSTGDGTFGNPYKTITTASTGRTGADEVRVAKSPDNTDLSGTLTFTNNSNSIVTSMDLTSELIQGDNVAKSSDLNDFYEVSSVTTTRVFLYKAYIGTTETTTAKKLGFTDTGLAASAYDKIQEVMSSGTSTSSRLKISGGWTLSTQIQDGETNFKQTHANKWGYGLDLASRSFLEIEKLGFLRHYNGINVNLCDNNLWTLINSSNNSQYGIYIQNSDYNTMSTIILKNNSYRGAYFNICENNILNNFETMYNQDGLFFNSNSNYNTINNYIGNYNYYGIYLSLSNNNTINTPICNYNIQSGIYLNYNSNNNTVNTPTCNYNHKEGIYFNDSHHNIVNTSTCYENTNSGILVYLSHNNIIDTPTCNDNNLHGIFINFSHNNKINDAICNDCTQNGIYIFNSNNNFIHIVVCNDNGLNGFYILGSNNIITNLTSNDNGLITGYGVRANSLSNIINIFSAATNLDGDIYIDSNINYSESPVLNIQHYQTAGDNRCYYEFGSTYRDTIDARSTQCLKYAATSDTYYIRQEFFFATLNGVEKNISFYIKDNVAFNGDVQAALYFMEEKISGWLTIPTTTNYVKHTMTAQAVDITEDGVLELRIKVKGTTGNVFVDDLSLM